MVFFQSVQFFFFTQDRHSCLIIRWGNICDHTPFKTGTKSGLQCFHIFWRFITGDDDLLSGKVQIIKGMEKLFLCTFLTYNKLDIVDEKHIVVPVLFTKAGHSHFISIFTDFQSFDQFIRKGLTGYIKYLFRRIVL